MRDRRHFLAASTILFMGATLPLSLFATRRGGDVFTNGSLGAYAQGLMTQERFEQLVGSVFTVFLDKNAIAYLRLKAVSGMGVEAGAGHRNTIALQPQAAVRNVQKVISFNLAFSYQRHSGIEQGSYLVDHGTLGRFALFLVPGEMIQGNGTCGAMFSYL